MIEKRREVDETSITKQDLSHLGYYTVIALFGVLSIGYAINLAKTFTLPSFATVYETAAYGFTMAVAEEVWFRGVVTDVMLSSKTIQHNKYLGIGFPYSTFILSALVFTGYHIARYQTQFDALIYVFAGGFILSWVAWKTKRFSASIAAHGIGNLISILGAGI